MTLSLLVRMGISRTSAFKVGQLLSRRAGVSDLLCKRAKEQFGEKHFVRDAFSDLRELRSRCMKTGAVGLYVI